MNKQSILCFLAVCLWLPAISQEIVPVVLVASQGKLSYQSPESKAKKKVITGAVLKYGGAIQLKRNSSAVLFANGQFRQVEGKKRIPIAEQFSSVEESLVRLNFDLTFSNYLMSAVQIVVNPENASEAWGAVRTGTGTGDGWGAIRTSSGTGDGWGAIRTSSGTGDGWGAIRTGTGTGDGWGAIRTGTGTGDGWGGKGSQITAIQPFGKVLPAATTFHWSKPAGNPTFHVAISDMSNKVLLETTTRDTFLSIDLSQHNLSPGNVYQWSVSFGDRAQRSNVLSFELSNAAERDSAIERAERSELYLQSPENLRGLMRAVALERGDWYTDAAQTYSSVQKADPKNEMARLMHAAFWLRYGLKEVAAAAYGK